MKFDDLDKQMRVFETAHDHEILPGMFIVARLDGRSFTKLTKETIVMERPFDPNFNRMMCGVVEHLMTDAGFKFLYGYTESDEISLLFSPQNAAFKNKMRKLNSVLAGEASALFTQRLGQGGHDTIRAVFDCRISQLPRYQQVVDYFRWRLGDSERNALNSWCYWTLRDKDKLSPAKATSAMQGMNTGAKHDLLFARGINFNDLPAWQKRGVGFYWETYQKQGINPMDPNKPVSATRKRLKEDRELPFGDDYSDFVRGMLHDTVEKDLSAWFDFEEEG